MSTEARSTVTAGNALRVDGRGQDVDVSYLSDGRTVGGRVVDRADFLAAVADECDAIVIPREELPEVDEGHAEFHVGSLVTARPGLTARDARDAACEWLALAEYLDAHPPVDEAQVEALSGALGGLPGVLFTRDDEGYHAPILREIARGLLATGRIEVRP